MARKYDEIKWLAQATAQDLSADTEKWKGFLTTAGRLYRYSFMDVIRMKKILSDIFAADFEG